VTADNTFSLSKLPSWHPLAELRSALLKDGRAVGTTVFGEEIGLQLAGEEWSLIETCYDYFEGCSHWLYLFDRTGRRLDQISLPDVFGFIQEVSVKSPTEVSFGFGGTNDRWHVSIDSRGYWSYAPRTLLLRRNRKLFSKRHLRVWREKGLPWKMAT